MSEIEEMERRILSELQEAGEENIAAMINTVIEPAGNEIELALLRQALDNLVRSGLVGMALSRDLTTKLAPLPVDQSLAIAAKIDTLLRFQKSECGASLTESSSDLPALGLVPRVPRTHPSTHSNVPVADGL